MGLVALRTKFAGIVLTGNNLREPGGPSRVIIVTDGAIASIVRDFRRRTWILGMRSGRSMTNFAGDVFMIGLRLKIINIIVAFKASLGTCVLKFHLFDLIQCLRAVMPVKTKRGRYKELTDNNKSNKSDGKKNA